MDLVLTLCDDLFLDALYSRLLPISAFADAVPTVLKSVNGSTLAPILSSGCAPSTWSQVVSYLPHPPLSYATPGLNMSASLLTSPDVVSAWPRDYIPRQLLSISVLTLVGIHLLYFIFASLSYQFIFDHNMMRHPRFLKNQVRQEIECSLRAFPMMTLLTLPWFFAEVQGYSNMYDNVEEYGWLWLVASVPIFLLFTDYGIYWVHRLLHHPLIYKYIHKPHHKWIIPTPFASHAFHPVDGYLQSVPYHLIVFLLPFHRYLYLGLFVVVNFWSIFIHDSDMITGHPLETIINGPAHHTLHHLYFTVNYGQYFTWADKFYGSYRQPQSHLDPMLEIKRMDAQRQEQEKEKLGKSQ
ncbi:fatty acid hydroxylase [Punctularia strigosozonata HHB-11173 SS5]|uniref:fatty acid hydroxylase n=1 Tax=Punctularia strigosozonata (strain HHB-11173) TaxID=741275 RepID=UPI0004417552|nr:fatty acid hydroxylase [Punctularia strigosozonata HHB-11173 SS5]EIN09850.1 fatty acid hydroxylase [Punctularia strigosozonata HHB-11173 SS5]